MYGLLHKREEREEIKGRMEEGGEKREGRREGRRGGGKEGRKEGEREEGN